MSVQVLTIEGLIDRDLIQVVDEIVEDGNGRMTTTKWYFEGRVVRQDGHFNLFKGFELGATVGS
jgi:hypothetical protein